MCMCARRRPTGPGTGARAGAPARENYSTAIAAPPFARVQPVFHISLTRKNQSESEKTCCHHDGLGVAQPFKDRRLALWYRETLYPNRSMS